jgi:hypothetical protein
MVILTPKIFIKVENLGIQNFFCHQISSFTALGLQNQALEGANIEIGC